MEEIKDTIKLCIYCLKENKSIWHKCNKCRSGDTIYDDGKICITCKEKKIPIQNQHWQSYCNKCYGSKNKDLPYIINNIYSV